MKNMLIITYLFCISTSGLFAQEKLQIELKDAPKPDIYIDGKKYDYAIFELLDQSKIESVNVIKGELAMKEYNATNGVIVIKTKKSAEPAVTVDKEEIKIKNGAEKDPVVIIDGEVSNREALSKMAPGRIKSIDIYKGDQAMALYNAPNGVIIVTTKK